MTQRRIYARSTVEQLRNKVEPHRATEIRKNLNVKTWTKKD